MCLFVFFWCGLEESLLLYVEFVSWFVGFGVLFALWKPWFLIWKFHQSLYLFDVFWFGYQESLFLYVEFVLDLLVLVCDLPNWNHSFKFGNFIKVCIFFCFLMCVSRKFVALFEFVSWFVEFGVWLPNWNRSF